MPKAALYSGPRTAQQPTVVGCAAERGRRGGSPGGQHLGPSAGRTASGR